MSPVGLSFGLSLGAAGFLAGGLGLAGGFLSAGFFGSGFFAAGFCTAGLVVGFVAAGLAAGFVAAALPPFVVVGVFAPSALAFEASDVAANSAPPSPSARAATSFSAASIRTRPALAFGSISMTSPFSSVPAYSLPSGPAIRQRMFLASLSAW